MAHQINADECTSCGACEFDCPNGAISEGKTGVFVINAKKCTDCDGHSDEPTCVGICPITGCILPLAA